MIIQSLLQYSHLLTVSNSQKFYKLKKESENLLSGDGTPAPAKTPTTTPRGKGGKAKAASSDGTPAKTPTKAPASTKRKQKAVATGDAIATSKKVKKEVDEAEPEDIPGVEDDAAGVDSIEDASTELKNEADEA